MVQILGRAEPAPDSGGAPAEARVARLEVHRDPASVRAVWQSLEAEAAASPYQTWAWTAAWIDTRGRAEGLEPFVVVAYDRQGEALALLPLGRWRRGLVRVAGFLGGRDSNFNLGLFRPGRRWTAEAVRDLLRAAARAGAEPVDLLVLRNQPHMWEGQDNPLALLPGQPSPSFGYKVGLTRDPQAFFKAILSKEARKKLRRKGEKLGEFGPVTHVVAGTPAEAVAVIEAFVAQREARCAALGLSVSDIAGIAAFLRRASLAGSAEPSVELHALRCGPHVLATFAGAALRGRFCGMVISFDSESAFARFSPGDLLLAAIIECKCREGLSVFDLGIGEARYKDAFCPEPEPLFDTSLALSWRGRTWAAADTARLRLKRAVKQSSWAWPAAKALRKRLAGLKARFTRRG